MIAASTFALIFENPDTGERPLVVNTYPGLPAIRLMLWIISWANGGSGTLWGRLFLVRVAGRFQVAPSSLNSLEYLRDLLAAGARE